MNYIYTIVQPPPTIYFQNFSKQKTNSSLTSQASQQTLKCQLHNESFENAA